MSTVQVKKNPTVEGRWERDLMFSQRNNPYCDLLKILLQKYKFSPKHANFFAVILYICRNILENNTKPVNKMNGKHILGLDLGTNSIGWAVVNREEQGDAASVLSGIKDAGSRIIRVSLVPKVQNF